MKNSNYILDEFFFRLIFVCLSHLHLLSKIFSWDIVVLSCRNFLNEAISLLNLKSSQKLTVEGVTLCNTQSGMFLLWILGMLFLPLALPASEEKKWKKNGVSQEVCHFTPLEKKNTIKKRKDKKQNKKGNRKE